MVSGSFDTDSGSHVLRSGRRGEVHKKGRPGVLVNVAAALWFQVATSSAFRGCLKMRKYRHIHSNSLYKFRLNRFREAFRFVDATAGLGLSALVLHACKVQPKFSYQLVRS
jgi:hypothetical protein